MVFVPTPTPADIADAAAERCGVQRGSMRTNVLIHRSGLGEVNKVMFSNPGPDRVFGVPKCADPEGARDVTMLWKEHKANPDDVPGPDFKGMNKLAAVRGLTTAAQQPAFRATNTVCLKKGDAVKKAAPPLPSDIDPSFTYGMPGTHRTAEQTRNGGTFDPPTKKLVQAQYQDDWRKMNALRAAEFDARHHYIPPRPTVATRGHAYGAAVTMQRTSGSEAPKAPFKLSKFKRTPAKITTSTQKLAAASGDAVSEPIGAQAVAA